MSEVDRTIPLVSVLLPVHNGASTLEAAIGSVLGQSLRGLELIVVDDGSDDATPALLEAVPDPRVKVLRNPHQAGISASLNRALAEAQGQFIARMDADDTCHVDRLRRQVSYLQANPGVRVCGTAMRLSNGRVWRFSSEHGQIAAGLLFSSSIAHPTVMICADAVREVGLCYDSRFDGAEDYHLWVRHMQDLRYANLPDVLYDYRFEAGAQQDVRTARQRLADEVRLQALHKLGIVPNARQQQLHNAIATWDTSGFKLEEIEAWLGTLLNATADRPRTEYDAQDIISERFFAAARLAALRDDEAFAFYRRSSLRRRGTGMMLRESAAALRGWLYRQGLIGRSA